jgi:small Trp-rich protein
MGLCSVLTLIFVVLKLAEIGTVATWSWWWVLSPLWIGALVALTVVAITFLVLWAKDML